MPSDLSVPQAQKITQHLRSLEPSIHTLRLAIIHTYTSDLLDPWLNFHAAIEGLDLETYHAPYGLSIMEAQQGSALSEHKPNLTLLMLQREDLHPDLRQPVTGYDAERRESLRGEIVDNLANITGQFRATVAGHVVVTILPPSHSPALGLFDRQAEGSEAAWWARLKDDIAARFRDDFQATILLDLDEMLSDIGRNNFFDLRFWYSARFPFSPAASCEFARRVVCLGAVSNQTKAKVIVLDADNTMWGGIVGEDGFDGIALGPEYPGNAYVDFQRRILDYQQRGFILAICSKNNPADVDEVLQIHPHQVLQDEHFAAKRVNWQPKSQNLSSLAEELNLGLDSFIFVDDSDHECALIRRELPQVQVVQISAKPVDVPATLDRITRLEILSLTKEDRAKTELYAQERQRRQLQENVSKGGGDIRGYLDSLKMKMRVEFNNPAHLARLAQLTQKTNQFNLTARRYTEQDIGGFIESDDWLVASFSLADTFGDSGIVSLALIQRPANGEAVIDSFLMSCRVIGRQAETAFLETLLAHMSREGCKFVVGDYLPTAKNALVANFFADHDFEKQVDGRYRRALDSFPPADALNIPIEIEIG